MTLPLIITVLAVSVALGWVAFAVRRPQKMDVPNVLAVLRYGSALRIAALVIALAPPALLAYIAWNIPWPNDTLLLIAGACFVPVCAIAGLLLIEVERVQIILTDEGITRLSPWTGQLTLNWSEIGRVGYSPANRWFLVQGGGRTLRVSRHLKGIGTFVELVRSKVGAERYAGAASVFESLVRGEVKGKEDVQRL
jgi:hypothetical protein